MVEKILMIIALCIVAAILGKVLEKYNKEQALFVTIAACTIVLTFLVVYLSPLISMMNELFNRTGTGENYSQVIIKSLGICYVTQLGFDVCKDCNENALATVVEVSGKVTLIILAIPLLEKLINIVTSIM
ncbi:MAG: hypothetical protein GX286_04195 [Clostridiales bacterium]|jgi:stage III sporulation protein AD|nr:hypothetical protein [Clostridiales bacterium]